MALLFDRIISKKESIAVVGLGYVGMPIAVEFAKHINVIGFDINKAKIEAYKNGVDPTQEVGDETIKVSTVKWGQATKLSSEKQNSLLLLFRLPLMMTRLPT